jgi:hypothetical protein
MKILILGIENEIWQVRKVDPGTGNRDPKKEGHLYFTGAGNKNFGIYGLFCKNNDKAIR